MKRAVQAAAVVVYCFGLPFAGSTAAQDWPQWRGPHRDAKAISFEAPATWPKELTKKWDVKVGDGVATPALVDGKLYVFTLADGKETLRCLDAASGNEVWQEGYEQEGAGGPARGFAGPRCSPTVSDGKVVTLGVRGVLVCRDAATGKQLWRNDDFTNDWPMFFTSSSPIVVSGLCIAQLGGRDDGGVIAYDLASGDEKWRWMEGSPAYGSPVQMDVDGTQIVIAPTESKMVAIAAADGKLLWEMPYTQGRYNSASPMVDGQTLVIAGPGTGLTAFKMQMQDGKLTESKLWRNTDNSVGFNTPVQKNELMFGLSSSDQLFCINTETETTAWSAPFAKPAAEGATGDDDNAKQSFAGRVPATLVQFVQQDEQKDRPKEDARDESDGDRRRGFDRGPGRGDRRGEFGPGRFGRGRGFGGRGGRGMGRSGYGSIVDVDSALLALTPAGELVAFQPDEAAYTELARYKVAEGGTYAYPVPADHGIYVKDQESLTLWTVE